MAHIYWLWLMAYLFVLSSLFWYYYIEKTSIFVNADSEVFTYELYVHLYTVCVLYNLYPSLTVCVQFTHIFEHVFVQTSTDE